MLRHGGRRRLSWLLHRRWTPLLPSMRRWRTSAPLMLWPLLSPIGVLLLSTLLSRRRILCLRRTSSLRRRTTPISIPVSSIHISRRRSSLSIHSHGWSSLPLWPSSTRWSTILWRLLRLLLPLPPHVSPIRRDMPPGWWWSSIRWLLKVGLATIRLVLMIARGRTTHALLSCCWGWHLIDNEQSK